MISGTRDLHPRSRPATLVRGLRLVGHLHERGLIKESPRIWSPDQSGVNGSVVGQLIPGPRRRPIEEINLAFDDMKEATVARSVIVL